MVASVGNIRDGNQVYIRDMATTEPVAAQYIATHHRQLSTCQLDATICTTKCYDEPLHLSSILV
jgi:hypothetical protein